VYKMKFSDDLPDCELLNILSKKIDNKGITNFDFRGKLIEFCKRVSEEIRQINELFPEYTPHDQNYHLKHLFRISDELLGIERYNGMNLSELFFLAIGLYGHDWGMAVSNVEKEYIFTGKIPKDVKENDYYFISDENKKFREFLKKENIS